jgi:predicted lipoprotein
MKMAKAAGSWLFLAGLGGLGLLAQLACETAQDTGAEIVSDALGGLLAAVGPDVVLPMLEDFHLAGGQLNTQLAALDQAYEGQDAASALAAAQDQYVQTMSLWQQLEVLQIGPAGSSLYAIGGEDLRDEIYSYPNVNRCRSDQETLEQDWNNADYFSTNLANSYGLDTVEYLLYGPDALACPSQVGLDSQWDALSAGELGQQRAQFALAVSEHALVQSGEIESAWTSEFSQAIVDGAAPYESKQEAFNAVFDAMFYLEKETKDRKLGAAIESGSFESPESGHSALWIHNNVLGFERLFFMGELSGFDVVLDELGHGDLAEEIRRLTTQALDQSEGLGPSLEQALQDTPQDVMALKDTLSELGGYLKGDLATVLSLQVPTEAAGDSD